jgi:hypothetical protein
MVQGSGFRGSGFWVLGSGFRGSGFKVLGFRVQRHRVQGSGFRGSEVGGGSRFRVQRSTFGVEKLPNRSYIKGRFSLSCL